MKDVNDVCERIIAIYSFGVIKEKVHQVISQVIITLAKKDIEKFRSDGAKSRLLFPLVPGVH